MKRIFIRLLMPVLKSILEIYGKELITFIMTKLKHKFEDKKEADKGRLTAETNQLYKKASFTQNDQEKEELIQRAKELEKEIEILQRRELEYKKIIEDVEAKSYSHVENVSRQLKAKDIVVIDEQEDGKVKLNENKKSIKKLISRD
ncbi:hypothetical protein [Thalassobacillus sp. C254]|uniref:hypothetical protein n=1 Tax=Thalassobacillus sp. C254 TaxID=1225341 RepID=UPI0006CF8A50|nr:hypothetical protein [Thalassobacillus sp. C254]